MTVLTAAAHVGARFLIQILPAAVVAPLFFRGEIEFGVINQSSSAFNHILSDVSIVVYQVQPSPRPYDTLGPKRAHHCGSTQSRT